MSKKAEREETRGETYAVTENRILAIEEEQKAMNKTLSDINTNVSKLADAQKFSNEMLSREVIDTKKKLEHVATVAKNTAIKVDRKEQQEKGQKIFVKKVTKIIASVGGVILFIIGVLVKFKII